jgi:hypothetical protein
MTLHELAKVLKPLIVENSQLFILVWRQDRQWNYAPLWNRDGAIEWTPEVVEENATHNVRVAEVKGIDPCATIMAISDFFSTALDGIKARIVQHYEATRREMEDKS